MTIVSNVGCSVDLFYLSVMIRRFEYDIVHYNGGIWRFKPRGTLLIFSTGKVILVGIKSLSEGKAIFNKLKYKLKFLKYNCLRKFDIQVKNVVGLIRLDKRFNLPNLYNCFQKEHNVTYEPELHNALQMRTSNGIALIFVSGKIVITGCKDIDAYNNFVNVVYNMLKCF